MELKIKDYFQDDVKSVWCIFPRLKEVRIYTSPKLVKICTDHDICDAGGSYAISKFALYGFSQNLRHELKQHKVRVTAVLPGAVLTDSWNGTQLPASRFINVDDVAKLIYQAWEVSDRTVVEEILIRPMEGDI